MGGADDKPVWERIAELGFADAVESKGFKRVNATHWKMEGDGLTWRVRLVRGYRATPTSFLPVHGALVHGLDELYEKWDGSKASEYLHGAGQRVHMQSDTGADVTMAQKRDYDRLYPASRIYGGWLGLFKDMLEDMRLLRARPIFDRDFLNIRYWGLAGESLHADAFLTEGHDLDDVARVVTDYWERYSWPWIKARLGSADLYRLHWGPGTHSLTNVHPFFFAVAEIAGDRAFIAEMAQAVFREARLAIERAERMGFSYPDLALYDKPKGASTDLDGAVGHMTMQVSSARQVVGIGRAFGLDLPAPALDFVPFEAYILRNAGPDAPVLRH